MSEFIEIGGQIWRSKEICAARPSLDEKRTFIKFYDGNFETVNEPYESVCDKLLGKPPKPRVDDRRSEFADQLVAYFRRKGQNVLAAEIAAFYNSTMLSETEGAG